MHARDVKMAFVRLFALLDRAFSRRLPSCRSFPSHLLPLVLTIVCLFSFRSWASISILLPFASLITAVSIGGAAAVLVTSAVAAVYIPSAVSTVLKFRSGVLGSLRDKKFQLYRVARTYRFATEAIER